MAYGYEIWERQDHDDSLLECTCMDCRENAQDQLADHLYDMWHDSRGER